MVHASKNPNAAPTLHCVGLSVEYLVLQRLGFGFCSLGLGFMVYGSKFWVKDFEFWVLG